MSININTFLLIIGLGLIGVTLIGSVGNFFFRLTIKQRTFSLVILQVLGVIGGLLIIYLVVPNPSTSQLICFIPLVSVVFVSIALSSYRAIRTMKKAQQAYLQTRTSPNWSTRLYEKMFVTENDESIDGSK